MSVHVLLIFLSSSPELEQVMPNKAKAVFDSGKTSSYHIKSIADCQQSATTPSIFKLILTRGAKSKRYDFEAESPKYAGG